MLQLKMERTRWTRVLVTAGLALGAVLAATSAGAQAKAPQAQGQTQNQAPANGGGKKPNILVIFGDDVGQTNISAFGNGMVGYRTPNIDRIANEGMKFTDYYAENSCTAGRSSFITGQTPKRTGLSKVGLPARAPVARFEWTPRRDGRRASVAVGRTRQEK